MAFLRLEVRGEKETVKKLAVIAQALHEAKARKVFLDGAGIIQRRAIDLAPVRHTLSNEGGFFRFTRSQGLRRAILVRSLPAKDGRPIGAIAFVNLKTRQGPVAPHAHLVEGGTKPHAIRPKSKKMLKYQVGGRTVFARAVQHPGARKQPFFKPAVRSRSSEARQFVREGLTKVINEAAS